MLFKNATQTSTVVPRWNPKGLSVAMLTALWRSVALNSSPMVLSWTATLLSCNVPSSGPLGWDESLDRCSVCGSRSGRGPRLWLRSCCVLWSKPTAQRPKSVNQTESGIPSFYLNRLLPHAWFCAEKCFTSHREPLISPQFKCDFILLVQMMHFYQLWCKKRNLPD